MGAAPPSTTVCTPPPREPAPKEHCTPRAQPNRKSLPDFAHFSFCRLKLSKTVYFRQTFWLVRQKSAGKQQTPIFNKKLSALCRFQRTNDLWRAGRSSRHAAACRPNSHASLPNWRKSTRSEWPSHPQAARRSRRRAYRPNRPSYTRRFRSKRRHISTRPILSHSSPSRNFASLLRRSSRRQGHLCAGVGRDLFHSGVFCTSDGGISLSIRSTHSHTGP